MRPARLVFLLLAATIPSVLLVGIHVDIARAEEPPILAWEARFNRPYSEDRAQGVATDSEGNIYVTGSGRGQTGSDDFVTVKYDPSGNEIWKSFYNYYSLSYECRPEYVQGWESPADIGIDRAGNLYVVGTSSYDFFCPSNHYYDYTDIALVKYAPHGGRVWAVSLHYLYPSVRAMAVDPDGNTYIAATVDKLARVIKYSPYGYKLWTVSPLGEEIVSFSPADIAVDALGNSYVAGRGWGDGTGYDYAVIKYDPEGNQLWEATYNGSASQTDEARSIAASPAGDVFVTGRSRGTVAEGGDTQHDYATVRYDSEGNEVWVARYRGTGDAWNEAHSISVDELGNVFVTGTADGVTTEEDIVTVGYDWLGNEVWVQRYDGPISGNDRAMSLTLTTGGDVVVTGRSEGAGSSQDYATVSYEPFSGSELWAARYDGPAGGQDVPVSVVADGLGNVIVAGSSDGIETGSDYATLKYDPEGNLTWTARFENPGMGGDWGKPVAMTLDSSGNVCVTGCSTFTPYIDYDCATVKYDPNGNELWAALYDGTAGAEDEPSDLAVDEAGNIHITGFSEGVGTGEDFFTIKYDTMGNEQWVTRYNGPANAKDRAEALTLDLSGSVYITGYSEGTGTGEDITTVKYDSDGNELWVARYDGPTSGTDQARELALDGSGNIYIVGYSQGSGPYFDYVTVKYDTSGNEQWIRRYDGPASTTDKALALALDDFGNVYILGESEGVGTFGDLATIKYDPAGNELWVARFDGIGTSGVDHPAAIALDASGNAYITGWTFDYDTDNFLSVAVKYDPDGNELWAVPLGHGWAGPGPIALDSSGAVYVGTTASSRDYYGYLEYEEFHIVKLDPHGNLLSEIVYNAPFIGFFEDGRDTLMDMSINNAGELHVIAATEAHGTLADYATMKYNYDYTCNDQDGDGYGTPGSPECPYSQADCDDTDPDINPGNVEDDWQECHNGMDDNCDGFTDFDPFAEWGTLSCMCFDYDGDGHGSPEGFGGGLSETISTAGCAYPGTDCDILAPEVHPNAPEVCDGVDNQCPGDPGYGEIDEGCPLALVSPENGVGLTDPPTFTWLGGENDQFYLYLVIPIYGYGYLTFVIPSVEHEVAFPAEAWQDKTIPNWWCAWRVLGVNTSVEPPTLEASELWWFRKVM